MMAREAAKSATVKTNPVAAGEAEMKKLYLECLG